MKYFIIFFIISLSQTKENIEEKGKKILFPKSENIFELKQDDYEDFIKDNKYIILIFYTQWCEQCKNIMSILEQISIYCKENNDFIIARIDTDKSQDLAEKFFLSKIPSIYYIIDSNPKKYNGIFSYEEIKDFIDLKIKGPIIKFKTINEINDFVNRKNITILTTQPNEIFKKVSKKFEDLIFFSQCISNECKEKYENSNIILLKNYDEKIVKFDNKTLNSDSLIYFISKYSIEKGGILNNLGMQFLFKFKRTTLIYFRSQKNNDLIKYDSIIKKIANNYNEKMYFFISDITGDEFSIKIGSFFKLEKDDIPSIQIFDLTGIFGKVNSYEFDYKKYNNNEKKFFFNEEILNKFIEDFYKGNIEKRIESEPIPKDNFAYMTVVGKNFNDIVLLNNKNIIVLFISESCLKCNDASMKFVELATKYNKDLPNYKIEFRIMNLSFNSLKNLTINKFPSVFLFKINEKKNPIEYEIKEKIISKDLEEWSFKLCELGDIPNWERNITEFMINEEMKNKEKNNDNNYNDTNKENDDKDNKKDLNKEDL